MKHIEKFLLVIHDYQSYVEPAPGAPSKLHRKKQVDEHNFTPLEDPVLSKNIGVPIVIVGCKSDTFEFLEKEYGFKEPHFDFIQQYLRKIALSCNIFILILFLYLLNRT